jgi:2-dehydropantoate 2-reductase
VSNSERRWLIVGVGGIGGYFGGLLAHAGHDVTFLARGDNLKAIQANGLRIDSVDQSFVVHPVRSVESVVEDDPFDVILFCTKSYDNETAAQSIVSAAGDETVTISIQNGLGNDSQIQRFLPGVVYPGLAHIVSARTSPGVIQQSGGARTVFFGDPQGLANETLKSIANDMQSAGIDATAADDILHHLWNKFVFIVAFSGMTSYCRAPIGPILRDPIAKAVFCRCVAEAAAVAKALKVNVDREIETAALRRAEAYLGKQEGATSSMLRDLLAGRPTEIESLNGAIVKEAAAQNVDVPVNSAIYAAVRLASANRMS